MRDSGSTQRHPVFARTYDVLNAGGRRTLFPEHRRWLVAVEVRFIDYQRTEPTPDVDPPPGRERSPRTGTPRLPA